MPARRFFVARAERRIDSTPEVLFDLLTADEHFFAMRPTAVAHEELEPLPSGGHHCTQTHRTADGRLVQLRSTSLSFEPPKRVVDRAESEGTTSIVTMTLDATPDGGTTVAVTHETHVQAGFLTSRLVARQVQRSIEASLARLASLAAEQTA